MRFVSQALVAGILVTVGATKTSAADLENLIAIYQTQPRGYPIGKEYARPDTSVPFRWHFYHDAAIARYEDAAMVVHVEPFNRLESAGVTSTYGSGIKYTFVAEHVTEGKLALKAEIPAAAIKDGKSMLSIKAVEGPIVSSYGSNLAVSCWCHYRWLKFDAFNPSDGDVHIRVAGAPFVLHPGANVVAVKTVDAAGHRAPHPALWHPVSIRVAAPARDVALYLDNILMEQETPKTLRSFQFAARQDAQAAPVLWPAMTPVETDTLYSPERKFGWVKPAAQRRYYGHSFRSCDNGILWGRCENVDTPFRIDLPKGRYGISIFASPAKGFSWPAGATVQVNGQDHVLIEKQTDAKVRRLALGGELWDFRPGSCIWEELVRPPHYPPTRLIYADAADGHLLIELPPSVALRAIIIFPEADKEAALKELGRLNYLMAESWDVTHGWVQGDFAAAVRYLGFHDESTRPQIIPEKLKALNLKADDFQRGFVTFQCDLTEAVYPDSIPSPEEAAFKELRGFASPGERECLTLGLLPLKVVKGARIQVSDLQSTDGNRILAAQIDVRFARYMQKCMEYGHHNHAFNYEPHDLVRRPVLDLYPGAARRAYIDVATPPDAKPGTYTGRLTIQTADGKDLAVVPLILEVLPIELQTPSVYFGAESANPLMKDFGLNTCGGTSSYDDAVKGGFKGVAVYPNVTTPTFKGKRLAWNSIAGEKALIQSIIADGRSGKGPRVFFGGPPPNERDVDPESPFYAAMLKEFPQMDIPGVTMPTYFFAGPGYAHSGYVWMRQIRTLGTPQLLEELRKSGKEFWFVDWCRHSKEHLGRFTFGFWLWRLGATGRFTTFIDCNGGYFGNTAMGSYPHRPYYYLLGPGQSNRYSALAESLTPGEWNPCRDLLLVREGIDDYRYIHTLDLAIKHAEAGKKDGPALEAARKFRTQLEADLSLDLSKYYETRGAKENVAYAENWYPRADNSWPPEKFQRVRRQCADHIVALIGKR